MNASTARSRTGAALGTSGPDVWYTSDDLHHNDVAGRGDEVWLPAARAQPDEVVAELFAAESD